MEEKPKKTLKSLGSFASGILRTPEGQQKTPSPVGEEIKVYRPFFPAQPPKPISMRLNDIRALDDDALMKWLTTENEQADRPLDDGSKMAITMELMRRQSLKSERPKWWKDPGYWFGAIAAVGAVIAAVPVVVSWLK